MWADAVVAMVWCGASMEHGEGGCVPGYYASISGALIPAHAQKQAYSEEGEGGREVGGDEAEVKGRPDVAFGKLS